MCPFRIWNLVWEQPGRRGTALLSREARLRLVLFGSHEQDLGLGAVGSLRAPSLGPVPLRCRRSAVMNLFQDGSSTPQTAEPSPVTEASELLLTDG